MNRILFSGSLLLVLLFCAEPPSTPSPEEHAENQHASECGGFRSLAKQKAVPYIQDSTDYCSAEKIRWKYDASEKKLSLLHTRMQWDCCAKLRMTVDREGSTYTIADTNLLPGGGCFCVCFFDTYCDVAGVDPGEITISYEGRDFPVNLYMGEGDIAVDTAMKWPVYPCPGGPY